MEIQSPVVTKMMAASLVGLMFDFSQRAFVQSRGARLAAAAGRNVLNFRLLCAMKIVCELSGAALVSLKGRAAEGAALALLGHLVFNFANDLMVSLNGDVATFPAAARKPLIITDAFLVTMCVGAALAQGPVAYVFAGLFTAFSAVYLFFKFILGKAL